MPSVNKVILIGNLGKDPESRYTPGGDCVTNVRIACTDQWKDKSGEKQERTEWVSVVLFGRMAENAGEYLVKGSTVYFEGRLQTRKYTDKAGVEKYATEVVADRMQFLSKKPDGDNASPQQRERTEKPKGAAEKKSVDDFDDDIPFVFNELEMEWVSPLHRRLRRSRAR